MKRFTIKYVIQRPIPVDDPRREEGYTHEEPHYEAEAGLTTKTATEAFERLCNKPDVVSASLLVTPYGKETEIVKEFKNPKF